MAIEWKYRGRIFNLSDIESIRRLIAANPEASRWALSRKLCEDWDWKQPNGALRDMVCRGLRRPPGRPARPEPVIPDDRPVCGRLSELGVLTIEQVRRTPQEALFNSLIEQYHYLGYEQPVGEHLKYLVSAKGQAIACLAWSSSPRHLGCRDRFIGWGMDARRRNIHLLAYNTRFLILPWVTVPHLASHILGRMARQVPGDWQRIYAHPLYLLETFVDPERFRGTCYRAANWVVVGRTTGRGKNDLTHKPNRSIKEVLALPVHRRFRELLSF
jgi:hypothetical protein